MASWGGYTGRLEKTLYKLAGSRGKFIAIDIAGDRSARVLYDKAHLLPNIHDARILTCEDSFESNSSPLPITQLQINAVSRLRALSRLDICGSLEPGLHLAPLANLKSIGWLYIETKAIEPQAISEDMTGGALSFGTELSEPAFDIVGLQGLSHSFTDFGQASFRNAPALESDLETFRENLVWAEHVVLITPMWWGGLPAKAKGLFDRVLLPGFAFDPRQRRMGVPTPLLSGRTAHFMLTSDTPAWAFWLMYGRALKQQVHRQIIAFVGLKPVRHTHYSPVEHSTPEIRARWISDTRSLGARAA